MKYADARSGGDNNLAVIMSTFEPKVQCRGPFETANSCKHVLADMPASTEIEVFGPKDSSFVMEELPQEIVSGRTPHADRIGALA